MFLLHTILKRREPAGGSADFPRGNLMEHLEALRRTIFGMLAVFAATFCVCFCLIPELMTLLSRPASQVARQAQAALLPPDISPEAWQRATEIAQARATLPDEEARRRFDAAMADEQPIAALATAIPYLRAAAAFPAGPERQRILEQSAAPGSRALTEALLASGAAELLSSAAHSSGVRFMGVFHPAESFFLSINVAFCGALVLSFPALLYLLLRFIMPGLHPRERLLLRRSVRLGSVLFLSGCAFAYFVVLPHLLSFFFRYSCELGIANEWRIGYYLTFAAKLVLLFGAFFELPVLLLPLLHFGILTPGLMRRYRGYALLGVLVLALVFAPAPDPATMLLIALPLYGLYEVCILAAGLLYRDTPAA